MLERAERDFIHVDSGEIAFAGTCIDEYAGYIHICVLRM